MGQEEPSAPRSRWSWSIGKLAGINVRMHATFLLLLAWIAMTHLLAGQGAIGALKGIALVAVVFLIVVLHELGHALTARRFGIQTRDITLLPIGGVARLERMPTDPTQELLVAVAGPMVNIVLAILCVVAMAILKTPWSPSELGVVGGHFLPKLLWLNVGLAVFNLLPAFPMDGGRVLRAFISLFRPRVEATQIASWIGQLMAVSFGLFGLVFGQPILFFIALFVWFGARQEARMVEMTASLEKLRVGDAMVTTFESLPADATASFGAERALHGIQREFPVVDHGLLVGFVNGEQLVSAANSGAPETPIGRIARPIGQVAEPSEPMSQALGRIQPDESVIPVFSLGRFVGLLFPENVMELANARRMRPA
jgi:Zn-dependent protease